MRFIHLIGPFFFFYDQSKGQGSEFVVVPILTPPTQLRSIHSVRMVRMAVDLMKILLQK